MKIAFIGGGNMGEAILSSLLAKGLSEPQDVFVSDVIESRHEYIKEKYNVSVTGNNKQAVISAEVVVLAIKPQNLTEVIDDLRGQFNDSQLVLSIIAGATIRTLSSGLSHDRIVRVMPNTPAQIGEGMSVWTAMPRVSKQQKEWAGSILGAIGKEIYVDDEKYLDMVTAVSGSGPAYFFLFVEALVEAAVGIGLASDMAQEMVLQTMLGSGHLIQKSGKAPAELRRMVTSKGGTTEAALNVLGEGEFTNLLIKAVNAAYDKAKILGGSQK
jgi:pyrroline-5-carboxylate reductase